MTIAWYSASSGPGSSRPAAVRPPAIEVAGGEVGHRVQREQEEQPERRRSSSQRSTRRPTRAVCLTAATSRCAQQQRVGDHHDRDDDDHLQRQRVGEAGWPSTTSLVSAERISSGTIGLPWLTSAAAVAYAAKALANNSSAEPRNAGRQQRDRHLAPVLPRRRAQADRRLAPLLAQPLQRGQEHDHHQRDLEVRVDQDQPGQAVQPAATRRDSSRSAAAPSIVSTPLKPDRREERESQCDAAELGQHAAQRDHRPAQHRQVGGLLTISQASTAPSTAPMTARARREQHALPQRRAARVSENSAVIFARREARRRRRRR